MLVILQKTEDMCSVAFAGDHRQQVSVRARSSVLLPYTVIPLKAGEFPLQVTAVARSFPGQDAVRKVLRVVVRVCWSLAFPSLISCFTLLRRRFLKGSLVNGTVLIRITSSI